MMCQEVIELMQRYLDRDLEDTEYGRMLTHLKQCPECSELFERLMDVSHELENLPKVSPKFSLVDSVLPQLEKLEMTEPDRLANPESPKERTKGGSWRKHVKEWISFPVFGGVAAAVLVIFFLFQQQFSSGAEEGKLLSFIDKKTETTSQHRADKTSEKGQGKAQKKEAAVQIGAKGKENIASAESADAMANGVTAGSAVSEANGSQPLKDHDPSKESAPGGNVVSSPEPQVQGDLLKKNSPIAAAQEPKATSPTAAAQEPKATSPTAAAQEPKGASSTAETPSSEEENAASQGEDNVQQSMLPPGSPPDSSKEGSAVGKDNPGSESSSPAGPSNDAPVSPGPRSKAGKIPPMGIMALPVPTEIAEFPTKDGLYIASFSNHRVTIRDKEGNTVYLSNNVWKEGIPLEWLGWSGNDTLTYKVQVEGQSRTFLIHVKEKSELEITL